jgi:sugar fermentation stimulation protein A
MDYLYPYPPLIPGILRKRYKRFFADVELESGEIVTAHCANTGPMTGICALDSLVYLSKSDNPKRKLAYTWEMIQIGKTWVGVNTGLPNRVIKFALENQLIPDLAGQYSQVQPEVPYGRDRKSRIDFVLSDDFGKNPIYLEIKNTTYAEEHLALFPDTVTARGQKHLRDLMELPDSAQAVMLYFINREDCTHFAPGDKMDATYGQLLRLAIAQGLKVLPCRFEVSPQGIRYLGLAYLQFSLDL